MHFAVTRVPGPSWVPGRSMREQPGWDEHAVFMDGLAARGFIILGGPLGPGDRFHFAVEAASEEDIRSTFAEDPWVPAGLLDIASVEPWRLVLRAPDPADSPPPLRAPEILLVTGPAGVGKSTLAWEIAAQLRQAGVGHTVLDSDELDRAWPLSPEARERLNRTNLGAFWRHAAELGQRRLILVGVFLRADQDLAWITAAIPAATVTRVVLLASDAALERRVRSREIGSEAEAQLVRTLRQAARFRKRNAGSPDVLDSEAMPIEHLAARAIARAGWATGDTAG